MAIVKLEDDENASQSELIQQKRWQNLNKIDALYEQVVSETDGELPDPLETLNQLRHERYQHAIGNLY